MRPPLISKISKDECAQLYAALVKSGFVDLTRSIIQKQRDKYALCKGEVSFIRCQNCRYLIEKWGAPDECALKRLDDLNML